MHEYRLILAVLTILAGTHASLGAQCTEVCGDATGDGSVNTKDLLLLIDYLWAGDTITGELECADQDDYDLITLRDASYLNEATFAGGPGPVCPSNNSKLVPTPTVNYELFHTGSVPAAASMAHVDIVIEADTIVRGLVLGMTLRVGGEEPIIDSLTNLISAPQGFFVSTAFINPAGGPGASVFISFLFFGGEMITPGKHTLATVHFTVSTTEPCPRKVDLEWVDMPPVMLDEQNNPQLVNYPMILGAENDAWMPLEVTCPVVLTGDLNLSGSVTSADIIELVNFVFKSGCSPLPCEGAGDADCSGAVTSSDIVFIVNYVFKGGDVPCDVCPLIAAGNWICP